MHTRTRERSWAAHTHAHTHTHTYAHTQARKRKYTRPHARRHAAHTRAQRTTTAKERGPAAAGHPTGTPPPLGRLDPAGPRMATAAPITARGPTWAFSSRSSRIWVAVSSPMARNWLVLSCVRESSWGQARDHPPHTTRTTHIKFHPSCPHGAHMPHKHQQGREAARKTPRRKRRCASHIRVHQHRGQPLGNVAAPHKREARKVGAARTTNTRAGAGACLTTRRGPVGAAGDR